MHKYQKIAKIGAGGQGTVSKAILIGENRMVAIKRVFAMDKRDGVPFPAVREIKALQHLKHPNVMELIEVFHHKDSVYLVFEFLEFDLNDIISDRAILLQPEQIKCYMKMLLNGVNFCHKNWILHRDIKPSNLLLAKDGSMKLADFGLARTYGSPKPKYSPEAVTRWYRPPELLFGSRQYGPPCDMWGVACIFAELMQRAPLFPGESDLAQLHRIMSVMGSPNETSWPGVTGLPDFVEFEKPLPPFPLKQIFHAAEPNALDLLQKILVMDPAKRWSAQQEEDEQMPQVPLAGGGGGGERKRKPDDDE